MDKMTGPRYTFEPYTPDFSRQWDEFVRVSRNGTFLFQRDYMDYHSDRFRDASLVALRGGRPLALLPACLLPDGTLSTHAGLTYGGWILPPSHLDGAALLELFGLWTDYCRNMGYKAIDYKPLPHIYSRAPSQEDLYALWRCGFSLTAVNLSSAIDLRLPWKFNMSKRQQLKKALRQDISIRETHDFASFWEILRDCLRERHDATPVHTLAEIRRLAQIFPDNIRLFTLSDSEGVQAGVCIYDTGIVAHSQYGATTPKARRDYYLTALYHHLLTEVFADHAYFDFGTSNEQDGRFLNSGLLNQKFSMGGTGVAYERYTLTLS